MLVYIVLTIIYKLYLQYSDGSKFYPDYFTNLVSIQSEALLNAFGYQTLILPHEDEPSMKLFLNGKLLVRIIEGCNGISVIILFLSFIAAFSRKLKITFIYMLSGSVLLYTVNLLRIVILTIGLYHYPEYNDVFHSVIFPLIIYGLVFLLWIFWVNRFSKFNKNNA